MKEGVALLGVHYPLGLRTCGSFGRVEVKKEPLKKVKEWDDLDVQRPLSVTEREQKLETLKELKKKIALLLTKPQPFPPAGQPDPIRMLFMIWMT